jgi:hypothetical protein
MMGISATEYTGKERNYDGYAQATVGTDRMTMTAFDQGNSGVAYDRRFSAGILCQSLAQDGNLWQAIGRIMRAPPEITPLFVWVQYPMQAYEEHRRKMLEAITERHMDVYGATDLVTSEYYVQYFQPTLIVEPAEKE